MTLKTKIAAACAAAAMVITMGAANAQMGGNAMTPMAGMPPGASMPMTPPSMSGPSMAPMSGGMSTTQTTQYSSSTASPDYYADSAEPLPDTGGEPLLMMMAGTLLAGSAFAMRRKLS